LPGGGKSGKNEGIEDNFFMPADFTLYLPFWRQQFPLRRAAKKGVGWSQCR
jgi:hypothetical protein